MRKRGQCRATERSATGSGLKNAAGEGRRDEKGSQTSKDDEVD
jgi:hypothetical protein